MHLGSGLGRITASIVLKSQRKCNEIATNLALQQKFQWRERQKWHQKIACVNRPSDKKLYPTLSFSTLVYKMGTGGILLGVTL